MLIYPLEKSFAEQLYEATMGSKLFTAFHNNTEHKCGVSVWIGMYNVEARLKAEFVLEPTGRYLKEFSGKKSKHEYLVTTAMRGMSGMGSTRSRRT